MMIPPGPRTITPEMLEWPGTPGRTRMLQAFRLLEERTGKAMRTPGIKPLGPGEDDGQGAPDRGPDWAEMIHDNGEFCQEATLAFAKLITTGGYPESVHTHMARTAASGCTADSIGLGLSYAPAGPDASIDVFVFSKMPRHPDWMGLLQVLPLVRGQDVVVIESPEGGVPGAAFTARLDRRDSYLLPFPPGQARLLEEVLRHHGARPVWVRSNNPGRI
jgi:hypothetical protein